MREVIEIINEKRDELSGLIFDVDSFSNADEYRSSYSVDGEESLLLYVSNDKVKDSLRGNGTLVSDEAVYVPVTVRMDRDGARVPLSLLVNGIVYENDGEVRLFCDEKQYRLFISNRGTGKIASGFAELLRIIQGSLLARTEARTAFRQSVKHIYSLIRTQFRSAGVLSGEYMDMLRVMEDFPEFRRESIFLQLENEYRRCNNTGYERLLSQKTPLLNEENIKVLQAPDDLFLTSFIMDLSDRDSYTDVKAIIDAYLRLKALPRLSLNEAHRLLYLCVRMEDYVYLEQLLAEVSNGFEDRQLWDFYAFYSEYRNHRMHRLVAKMAGLAQISQEELLYTNDMGLCSIHYAIMLGNKAIIRHILPLADWSRYKSPVEKDRICDCLYDPMFVATIIFKDEQLLQEIFTATSPKAGALVRSIRGMDAMIDINNRLCDKYPEHRSEYNEKIVEYKSMRQDMEAELNELAKAEIRRQRELYGIIYDAKHPLGNILLELFSDHSAILRWIHETCEDKRILKYKQLFFAASTDVDEGLSYYEYRGGTVADTKVSNADRTDPLAWDQRNVRIYDNPIAKAALEEERKKAEEKNRRREEFMERVKQPAPHEGSWFSPAAHEDLRALKEEYRVLVKKYHPDSSGDDATARILMRIMTERADILESIRRGAAV